MLTRRKKYAGLGIILLIFYGTIYAWSIFVAPLEAEMGWQRSQTSMTFSICMTAFCVGGIVSGRFIKRLSPRLILQLSAVCMLAGLVAAAFTRELWQLYLFYGGFCGFGIGLGYNATISTVTRWFPEQKGFISGILLMAFGSGSLIMSGLASYCLHQLGWQATFRLLGSFLFIIIFLAALRLPPPTDEESRELAARFPHPEHTSLRNYSAPEMLKSSAFWYFLIWASLMSSAGLTLMGHAAPYAQEIGATTLQATLATGTVSFFNGLGRIVAGRAFDRVGLIRTAITMSGVFILSVFLLIGSELSCSIVLLFLAYILVGLAYGGVTTAKSVFAYEFYGTRSYAMNFGILNCNVVPAAFLGPYLAGVLRTMSGIYFSTFIAIMIFGALALVFALLLRSSPLAREHRRAEQS